MRLPAALRRTRRRPSAFGAGVPRYAFAAVFAVFATALTAVAAVFATAFTAVAVVSTGATRVVATGARYPVIGCNDPRLPFQNRASWRYAPRACETGGSLGSTEGIAAAHWRGWGSATAHATGELIDGLGFTYPARITALRLVRGQRLPGTHRYGSWYARLRVVSARRLRGGIPRGPYRVTIDVTPQAALRRRGR